MAHSSKVSFSAFDPGVFYQRPAGLPRSKSDPVLSRDTFSLPLFPISRRRQIVLLQVAGVPEMKERSVGTDDLSSSKERPVSAPLEMKEEPPMVRPKSALPHAHRTVAYLARERFSRMLRTPPPTPPPTPLGKIVR